MAVTFKGALTHLADQFRVTSICDIILPDIAMNPVTKIQIFVIQGDKYICYQT